MWARLWACWVVAGRHASVYAVTLPASRDAQNVDSERTSLLQRRDEEFRGGLRPNPDIHGKDEDQDAAAADGGATEEEKKAAWNEVRKILRDILASDPQWLELPQRTTIQGETGPSELPVIVTYAGYDKQEYIDGAIMLGLAVSKHLPRFPRVCMVVDKMHAANKEKLAAAGWSVLDVPDFEPMSHQYFFTQSRYEYWRFSYAKINLLRLRTSRVFFLDADTYVLDNAIEDLLLDKPSMQTDKVFMAKEVDNKSFNSGVMIYRPSLDTFIAAVERMEKATIAAEGLDQPILNALFGERIVPLDPKFNVHGHAWNQDHPENAQHGLCDRASIAHYRCSPKPSWAAAPILDVEIRLGDNMMVSRACLQCPGLYRAFFCDMKANVPYLTTKLQSELERTGECAPNIYRSSP